jgi:hypothetical protein
VKVYLFQNPRENRPEEIPQPATSRGV